jgi:hypothetical protein
MTEREKPATWCVTHECSFGECRVTYRYFKGECVLDEEEGET